MCGEYVEGATLAPTMWKEQRLLLPMWKEQRLLLPISTFALLEFVVCLSLHTLLVLVIGLAQKIAQIPPTHLRRAPLEAFPRLTSGAVRQLAGQTDANDEARTASMRARKHSTLFLSASCLPPIRLILILDGGAFLGDCPASLSVPQGSLGIRLGRQGEDWK